MSLASQIEERLNRQTLERIGATIASADQLDKLKGVELELRPLRKKLKDTPLFVVADGLMLGLAAKSSTLAANACKTPREVISILETARGWVDYAKNKVEDEYVQPKQQLNSLIGDLEQLDKAIGDLDGLLVGIVDAPALSKLASGLEVRRETVKKSVSPGFQPLALRLIDGVLAEIAQMKKAMLDKMFGSLLSTILSPIKKYDTCNYYPTVLDNLSTLSKAVVLTTPFLDDARLTVSKLSSRHKLDIYELNMADLDQRDEAVEYCLDALSDSQKCYFITGFTAKRGSAVLKSLRRIALGSRLMIVHDPSPSDAYKLLESEADLRGELMLVRLTMPDFHQLTELMSNAGMLSEAGDEELLRRNCYAMGYLGLNEVMRAGKHGWRSVGEAFCEQNRKAFEKYFDKVLIREHLIDDGWDYTGTRTFEDGTKRRRKPFDYDYDEVSRAEAVNIRAILDDNAFTLTEKCGLLVKYIMSSGGDIEIWKSGGVAAQREMITTATKMLGRLLDTLYDIKVSFDEEQNGGVCKAGGREISYNPDKVKDWDYALGVIFHEVFHAVQATVLDRGFSEWYFDELGISQGRVVEWRWSNNNYVQPEENFKHYYAQVYEADARAFSTDCVLAAKNLWQRVRFEK